MPGADIHQSDHPPLITSFIYSDLQVNLADTSFEKITDNLCIGSVNFVGIMFLDIRKI